MKTALSSPRLRIGIETLGCRLNQYESDGIIQRFVASGSYLACQCDDGPDIAIINTCTVTEQADKRNRDLVKRILKKNPKCKIIITGCYAQTNPDKINLEGVAAIIGNDKKSSLFEIIHEKILASKLSGSTGLDNLNYIEHKSLETIQTGKLFYGKRPILNEPFAYGKVKPYNRVRAYIKIQDGCNKKCTYCKIPMARGKGVSRPVADILEHVEFLEDEGVPEIILTGVNLGWYRDRKENVFFVNLLEKILTRLKNTRLRLSSIEPSDVDKPLAELSLHPQFCNFLHVPLQSASKKILFAMRRSYSPYSFQKRIELVRSINSKIFLGTDIIIGFPGETEEDFSESLNFYRELCFAGIHAFKYSSRQGAPASNFPNQVPIFIIKKRMKVLQALRKELWSIYAKKQQGENRNAIIESINTGEEGDTFEAISDDNLRLCVKLAPKLSSKLNLKNGQYVKLVLGAELVDLDSSGKQKIVASLI